MGNIVLEKLKKLLTVTLCVLMLSTSISYNVVFADAENNVDSNSIVEENLATDVTENSVGGGEAKFSF